MEVRQELLIELRSSIPDFISSLERQLPESWARSHEMEERVRAGNSIRQRYCFVLNDADNFALAYAWIGVKSPTLLHVTDVLAHEGRLSYAACNQILQRFIHEAVTLAANEWLLHRFVEPACQSDGTRLAFARNPTEAARQANLERKLMFILHVAGNFEESKFT